jgi:hypothetical protein
VERARAQRREHELLARSAHLARALEAELGRHGLEEHDHLVPAGRIPRDRRPQLGIDAWSRRLRRGGSTDEAGDERAQEPCKDFGAGRETSDGELHVWISKANPCNDRSEPVQDSKMFRRSGSVNEARAPRRE